MVVGRPVPILKTRSFAASLSITATLARAKIKIARVLEATHHAEHDGQFIRFAHAVGQHPGASL